MSFKENYNKTVKKLYSEPINDKKSFSDSLIREKSAYECGVKTIRNRSGNNAKLLTTFCLQLLRCF